MKPTFNFWVIHELMKHEWISLIQQRNTWYLKKMHEFGIDMTKTVEEAYALDQKNE